jgi:hypothetical protein
MPARGRQKAGDPVFFGWGGSEAKKEPGMPGPDLFFRYFFVVFLNSPHRKTPGNVIEKVKKIWFWIFVV